MSSTLCNRQAISILFLLSHFTESKSKTVLHHKEDVEVVSLLCFVKRDLPSRLQLLFVLLCAPSDGVHDQGQAECKQ